MCFDFRREGKRFASKISHVRDVMYAIKEPQMDREVDSVAGNLPEQCLLAF